MLNAVNHAIDGWNGLSFSIPEVNTHIPGVGKVGGESIGTPNVGHVPTIAVAAGGIVTRPTLALIGEAGPEVVIPLRNGGMGSVVNLTVNLNGPVFGSDKQRIAQELAESIRVELIAIGRANSGRVFGGYA